MRRAMALLALLLVLPAPPGAAAPGDEPVVCRRSSTETLADLGATHLVRFEEDCRWAVKYVRYRQVIEAYYVLQADGDPPNFANAPAALVARSLETAYPDGVVTLRREIRADAPPFGAQLDYHERTGTNGLTSCTFTFNATRPHGHTLVRQDRPPACWPEALAVP